eukprot:1186941-Prorocentrum_minimum.AAC.3
MRLVDRDPRGDVRINIVRSTIVRSETSASRRRRPSTANVESRAAFGTASVTREGRSESATESATQAIRPRGGRLL